MDMGETLADTKLDAPSQKGDGTAAYLVIAMECQRPFEPPTRHSLASVEEVLIGRGSTRSYRRTDNGRRLRITIPNRWMSSTHVRLVRRTNGWLITDQESKNGTFVDGEPIHTSNLPRDALIEAGRTIFLFRAGVPVVEQEPPDVEIAAPDSGLATLNGELAREFSRLTRIAGSDLPVLILGGSGTGKELAARALHERSGRTGSFVGVNCGALPDAIIESELFGHKKGAFSGATDDHRGLIRSADGGTLFLDEIAELPPSSQVALLRVLQEGEVRPVGDSRVISVNVRVAAATLQDLPARIAEGLFREDLYARLAGLTVKLLPLSRRREDIGLICGAILRRIDPNREPRFEPLAARALFAYSWPLNIRELEHALRSALVLTDDDTILLDNLPEPVRDALTAEAPPGPAPQAEDSTLHDQLLALLRQHKGNVSAVARAMGKAPMQIYRWLKRFGIDVAEYRQ